MESRPQNPEFWNNLENFHPCVEALCPNQQYFSQISPWVEPVLSRG